MFTERCTGLNFGPGQRQRQRIEDLRAKLETQQQDSYNEVITPPDSVGHSRRQSTKDLGFNGFLTAPAILQQDPFSGLFDRGPLECSHSPMLDTRAPTSSAHNSNNPSFLDASSYTQQSSSGVAPIAWMGYTGSAAEDMWASDVPLDLRFLGQ